LTKKNKKNTIVIITGDNMAKVDLHIHTNCSDGNLSIEEILQLAVKEQIEEIAITDHDTIINLENYKELEKKYNITIIPGIEIPTNQRSLHIIGYDIKNYMGLENTMIELKKFNVIQNIKTIAELRNQGIRISAEEICENADNGIITYRDIVKYMYNAGYVSDPREVYHKYIGKGTKAYFPSKEFTIEEVIKLIKKNGGLPVLVHPWTINQNINLELLISYMKSIGLEGIEIYPPKLTELQISQYELFAAKYELFRTTGTDFHDSNHDKLGIDVDNHYLDGFHKKILQKER